MKRCKQCLVPESVPGISLSKDDVCNLCLDKQTLETAVAKEEEARLVYEADFEKTLSESRGQGEYDCLVPLSGGKDSIYLLYRLKAECKLKVLAFTVDVNIPGLAWDNTRRALAKLNIDHIIYSPSHEFYDKTFRYLLRNQEERGAVYTISYVYAPLFEGDAIKLAMEKGIPLVLAGYSPGQPVDSTIRRTIHPERSFRATSPPFTPGLTTRKTSCARSSSLDWWPPANTPTRSTATIRSTGC